MADPPAPTLRYRRPPLGDYAILFVMVLPNLVWILLDRGRWVSDTSLYALRATTLHHVLLHNAENWWSQLFATGAKPPILPWVGQFFVGIGHLIGDVDIGLLLVIFVTQFGALLLLHRALTAALGERSVALLGCLAVAAAPMFILLSTQFYVQMVQLLAVCWFLCVMSCSRDWDSLLTLLHLSAASAVAMLTTMSSPAYCFIPGMIALARAWTNRGIPIRVRGAHIGMGLFAALATTLAAAWYLKNLDAAVAYGRFGYSFAYAAEVRDVFSIKLAEWARLLLFGFFVSAFVSLLSPWAAVVRPKNEHRSTSAGTATTVLLVAQIVVVLLMLTSSAHQTFRYLLPLAPYFATVGSWSLSRIDRDWLRRVTFVALGLQLAVTNASMYLWDGGHFARERQRYVAALDAITQAIDDDSAETVWLGTGELGVFNFDLAYHMSKSPDYDLSDSRSYYSIENRLAEIGGDIEALWKQMETGRSVAIVLQRGPQPPLDQSNPYDTSQELIRATRSISSRVRTSAKFEKRETPDWWEIEIYRDVGETESSERLSDGDRNPPQGPERR